MKTQISCFKACMFVGLTQVNTYGLNQHNFQALSHHCLNKRIINPLLPNKAPDSYTSTSIAGLFSMETALPAVHTLPAARLAPAAQLELGLMQKCEAPRKLLGLIHPLNSACSLLERAEGTSARESTAPLAQRRREPKEPVSKRSKIPVEDPGETLGRKVATFLLRGLFLVLDLILLHYYIKKKESCTIVPQKGDGRNRKCSSKYNKKVALEKYCVVVRDNYKSLRVRTYFKKHFFSPSALSCLTTAEFLLKLSTCLGLS